MSWNSVLESERPRPAAPPPVPAATASPMAGGSNASRRYMIAAVNRAFDVLEALQNQGPSGLADLSSAANCTRTAAFRLLRTLQARGYATQDRERGIWRLGSRWPALGRAAESQGSLALSAARLLSEASLRAGEHIYLLIRAGRECEVAALHETGQPIRRYAASGSRLPLHAGPCRLLLADAPAEVRAAILGGPLAKVARATPTDPGWIAKELVRVKQRGWSATADELQDGVTTLAVPVQDANRQTCAVLCVMTPSFRLRPPRHAAVLDTLRDAAARLSLGLGSVTDLPPRSAAPSARASGMIA